MSPRPTFRIGLTTLLAALLALAAALPGCESNRRRRARAVQPDGVVRDVHPVLQGIVGSQATLRGEESLLVSGYGLIVGLNGTGGRDVPGPVRAYMEREMSLLGVGQESAGMGGVTPTEVLNDPNSAVVLVRGAVPPGAIEGTRFDVMVSVVPGSSATSLESGRLWTTDLREGVSVPGGPATQTIAKAKGEVFINPFADPAKQDEDAIVRTSGRVLNGGAVVTARDLVLVLDNPSHSRARSIVSAINAKFPQARADRDPTARGVNEEIIQVSVPTRFAKDSEHFIRLLMHTRVDQGFDRAWATRYGQVLREEPALAETLSWALEALGEVALPALRDMYTYSEVVPRLAALRAGAGLDDALAAPHLKDLATDGPPSLRLDAIELLGNLGTDPRVNLALRELLESEHIDVRLAAYEALAERGDPMLRRRAIGDKFLLDVVPAGEPTVYVSQQETPRIVVFGEHLAVERPSLVTGWDNRLMLAADGEQTPVRLYYRDYEDGGTTRIDEVSATLPDLIQVMAHEPTPENPRPGLALSYSEVVGALHELWSGGAFNASFIAEQDRLAVEMIRSMRPMAAEDRPETGLEREDSLDDPLLAAPEPEAARVEGTERPPDRAETEPAKRSYVVPIPRNLGKKQADDGG